MGLFKISCGVEICKFSRVLWSGHPRWLNRKCTFLLQACAYVPKNSKQSLIRSGIYMVNRSSHLSNLCSATWVILSRDVDEELMRKNAPSMDMCCVCCILYIPRRLSFGPIPSTWIRLCTEHRPCKLLTGLWMPYRSYCRPENLRYSKHSPHFYSFLFVNYQYSRVLYLNDF
jgi:hypothetical protein